MIGWDGTKWLFQGNGDRRIPVDAFRCLPSAVDDVSVQISLVCFSLAAGKGDGGRFGRVCVIFVAGKSICIYFASVVNRIRIFKVRLFPAWSVGNTIGCDRVDGAGGRGFHADCVTPLYGDGGSGQGGGCLYRAVSSRSGWSRKDGVAVGQDAAGGQYEEERGFFHLSVSWLSVL